jgi:hypothetical protein
VGIAVGVVVVIFDVKNVDISWVVGEFPLIHELCLCELMLTFGMI